MELVRKEVRAVTRGSLQRLLQQSGHMKQATSARLTANLVNAEVNKSEQAVNSTIDAAVEVNVQVIRGHRARLSSLNDAVETAKAKLLSLGDTEVRAGLGCVAD